VVLHQLQVERRTAEVRSPETDVLQAQKNSPFPSLWAVPYENVLACVCVGAGDGARGAHVSLGQFGRRRSLLVYAVLTARRGTALRARTAHRQRFILSLSLSLSV